MHRHTQKNEGAFSEAKRQGSWKCTADLGKGRGEETRRYFSRKDSSWQKIFFFLLFYFFSNAFQYVFFFPLCIWRIIPEITIWANTRSHHLVLKHKGRLYWFLTILIDRTFYCSLAKGFIQHLIGMHTKAIKQIQILGQSILRFFIQFIYSQEKKNAFWISSSSSLSKKNTIEENNWCLFT